MSWMSSRDLQWPDFSSERIGNLPQAWPFLRDPAFWYCLPFLLLAPALLLYLYSQGPGFQHSWGFWLAAASAVLHPLSLLWLLRDTYRWDIPQRGSLLAYFLVMAGLYLPIYFCTYRSEWLMHVASERRNR